MGILIVLAIEESARETIEELGDCLSEQKGFKRREKYTTKSERLKNTSSLSRRFAARMGVQWQSKGLKKNGAPKEGS